MGRPRKYADDAEKMRAFRERWAALTVTIERNTVDTIKEIAQEADVSQSEVVNQLCKFALVNFPWRSGVAFPFKRMAKQNPD